MKTVLKAFSVISHISCKLKGGDLSWRGRIEEIVLVGSSCFRAAGMSPLGGHVSVPAQYEAQMRRLGISDEPHENWHIFEVRRRSLCWYLFLRPLFRQHTRGYQYSFNSSLAPEKESGNVVSFHPVRLDVPKPPTARPQPPAAFAKRGMHPRLIPDRTSPGSGSCFESEFCPLQVLVKG